MANLAVKDNTRHLFCWRCGYTRYEWMNWHKLWQDKARCFYCRIDAIDRRYGPSATAETLQLKDKHKRFYHPSPTKWEVLHRKFKERVYGTSWG